MKITDIKDLFPKCTGCSACQSICPKNAIQLQADSEGFLQPVLDAQVCVDCGRCTEVCPITAPPEENAFEQIAAAYAASSDERADGSSGGIVGVLSQHILARGGVVYGAVFDKERKRVVHSSSECHSLQELSKSKYVQSDLGGTFREISRKLRDGIYVLFCGTPCQVVGLKRFLKKDYENLFTVDFFCHGVPSPGFFGEMLKDYESQGHKIENITFREKAHGWRNLHMRVYSKDGGLLEKKSSEHPYYFFFLKNYTLRRSCYGCELYKHHLSDLTVSDYWLIDKASDDDLGTSLLAVHSERAASLLREIGPKITYLDGEVNFSKEHYRHGYSTKPREQFWRLYQKKGYRYVSTRYFEKEKARVERNKKIKRIKYYIRRVLKPNK